MSSRIGGGRGVGEVALCTWVGLGSGRQGERRQAAVDMDNTLGHDFVFFLFVVFLFQSSLMLLLALWSVVSVLRLLWFRRQRW